MLDKLISNKKFALYVHAVYFVFYRPFYPDNFLQQKVRDKIVAKKQIFTSILINDIALHFEYGTKKYSLGFAKTFSFENSSKMCYT